MYQNKQKFIDKYDNYTIQTGNFTIVHWESLKNIETEKSKLCQKQHKSTNIAVFEGLFTLLQYSSIKYDTYV